MASQSTLISQRDNLTKELEEAISRRNQIKVIMTDPSEMDKFLAGRVATIKEKIAELDINDRSFMIAYCDMQARIGELTRLRTDLHMPENNCKEIQKRINEVDALIDAREEISKRERI